MGEGVSASDVIRVLKAHGVFVFSDVSKSHSYTIIQDGFLESHVLEGEVVLKMVHYFSRKLGIPIYHFWHPEVAETEAEGKAKAAAEKPKND